MFYHRLKLKNALALLLFNKDTAVFFPNMSFALVFLFLNDWQLA